MDFFSSFESRRRFADLRAVTARQEATFESLRRQLEDSEGRLDKAMLALESLIEILTEHEITSREEILARMDIVDLRDGKLDGKVTAEVVDCTACNRPISPKMARCLYCGAERPPCPGVVN